MLRIFRVAIQCLCVFLLFGCGEKTAETMLPEEPDPPQIPADSVLSRISLPEGFSTSFYSDEVPGARSMTLGDRGTLFVGTRDKSSTLLAT